MAPAARYRLGLSNHDTDRAGDIVWLGLAGCYILPTQLDGTGHIWRDEVPTRPFPVLGGSALTGASGHGEWAPQILLAQGQFGDLFFSSVIQ